MSEVIQSAFGPFRPGRTVFEPPAVKGSEPDSSAASRSAAPFELALDRARLDKSFLDIRREVELAIRHGELPCDELVIYPHLAVLLGRIQSEWGRMGEPELLEGCLGLVEKMHGNVGAAIIGYEFLQAAYLLADNSWVAERIADLELAYLAEYDVTGWQRQPEATADDSETGEAP